MRIFRSALFPLIVSALVVSCNDQPTSTESPAVDGPLFNFSNGPANPGPIIVRSQTAFAAFYVDTKKGISAIHGADIAGEFCNGIVNFDLVDLQSISVPEDANRLNELIQGADVTTSVWPFTNFDCGLFTTVTPLASGSVDLVSTDNDLLVFLNPDNRNANAFGFRAHGRLQDQSGARANFSGHSNCVWDGNDFQSLKCVDRINLQ